MQFDWFQLYFYSKMYWMEEILLKSNINVFGKLFQKIIVCIQINRFVLAVFAIFIKDSSSYEIVNVIKN